jgi:gliding motility-associated-like protein
MLMSCLAAISTKGQFQQNHWYFGINSALDFNTSPPVVLNNSAMATSEGCATISDINGALLFYTDGMSVWNRLHNLMPNGTGLFGQFSSTQSGIIVPKPLSNNIYYVFTADELGFANGLRYSVVDMNLQGGFGDVTIKNFLLQTPVSEKITAVRHQNGLDMWVIAHGFNNNSFLAYLVTSGGVDPVPVVSNVGPVHGPSLQATIGYLKADPNGEYLAAAVYSENRVELYRFDNATGVVYNPILINAGFTQPYGVEFSIDATLLYVTALNTGNPSTLMQFQIGSLDAAVIQASMVTISSSLFNLGSVQLSPDGRILVAREFQAHLGSINFPNNIGLSCGYVELGQSIAPNTVRLGLPTFVQSFFRIPGFTFNGLCAFDTTHFQLKDPTGVDSLLWDFGDPLSGANNISTLDTTFHIYSLPGVYPVYMYAFIGAAVDTSLEYMIITAPPYTFLGNDTTLCLGDSLVLDASFPASGHYWSNGAIDSIVTIDTAGVYWVEITNACASYRDTIVVNYYQPISVDLGPDSAICPGDSLLLNASFPYSIYGWSNGSSDSAIYATYEGWFWVDVIDSCSSLRDSVYVSLIQEPTYSLPADTILCDGDVLSFSFNPSLYDAAMNGSFGADSVFQISQAGTYWVEWANACFVVRDTMVVTGMQEPAANLNASYTLCPGDSVVLGQANFNANFLWSNGSTESSISVSSPGVYYFNAVNACGQASDTALVDFVPEPNPQLGNDTILCEGEFVLLQSGGGAQVLWSDGSTGNTLLVGSDGNYWVSVSNSCGALVSDSVDVEIDQCACNIFVPEAFTPNNDFINDVFLPISGCAAQYYQMEIFDRWGKLLFSTFDLTQGWDGAINGEEAPSNVYIVRIIYQAALSKNNRKQEIRSTINLIR